MKPTFFVPPALVVGGVVCCALFGGSCARVPTGMPTPSASGSSSSYGDKFLYVTMTVRGKINTLPPDATTTGNCYFVLINRSDDPSAGGAVPVVQSPWGGNGYAAPSPTNGQGFVGVVRVGFQGGSNQTGYGVYATTDASGNIVNPSTLGTTGGTYLGPPDLATPPIDGQSSGTTLTPGDQNTLYFRLNLSRLPNNNGRYVFINLIATNNLPLNVIDAPKLWDALGDGRNTGSINSYIRLDVTQNPRYLNQNVAVDTRETPGDVRDHIDPNLPLVDAPDIDIVDYAIEIRPQ